MTILSEFEIMKSHVGHDIACVTYGEANVSIECFTCNKVLHSVDKDRDSSGED